MVHHNYYSHHHHKPHGKNRNTPKPVKMKEEFQVLSLDEIKRNKIAAAAEAKTKVEQPIEPKLADEEDIVLYDNDDDDEVMLDRLISEEDVIQTKITVETTLATTATDTVTANTATDITANTTTNTATPPKTNTKHEQLILPPKKPSPEEKPPPFATAGNSIILPSKSSATNNSSPESRNSPITTRTRPPRSNNKGGGDFYPRKRGRSSDISNSRDSKRYYARSSNSIDEEVGVVSKRNDSLDNSFVGPLKSSELRIIEKQIPYDTLETYTKSLSGAQDLESDYSIIQTIIQKNFPQQQPLDDLFISHVKACISKNDFNMLEKSLPLFLAQPLSNNAFYIVLITHYCNTGNSISLTTILDKPHLNVQEWYGIWWNSNELSYTCKQALIKKLLGVGKEYAFTDAAGNNLILWELIDDDLYGPAIEFFKLVIIDGNSMGLFSGQLLMEFVVGLSKREAWVEAMMVLEYLCKFEKKVDKRVFWRVFAGLIKVFKSSEELCHQMFTMIKERVGVDSCNARTMVEYIRVCVRNESYVDILDVLNLFKQSQIPIRAQLDFSGFFQNVVEKSEMTRLVSLITSMIAPSDEHILLSLNNKNCSSIIDLCIRGNLDSHVFWFFRYMVSKEIPRNPTIYRQLFDALKKSSKNNVDDIMCLYDDILQSGSGILGLSASDSSILVQKLFVSVERQRAVQIINDLRGARSSLLEGIPTLILLYTLENDLQDPRILDLIRKVGYTPLTLTKDEYDQAFYDDTFESTRGFIPFIGKFLTHLMKNGEFELGADFLDQLRIHDEIILSRKHIQRLLREVSRSTHHEKEWSRFGVSLFNFGIACQGLGMINDYELKNGNIHLEGCISLFEMKLLTLRNLELLHYRLETRGFMTLPSSGFVVTVPDFLIFRNEVRIEGEKVAREVASMLKRELAPPLYYADFGRDRSSKNNYFTVHTRDIQGWLDKFSKNSRNPFSCMTETLGFVSGMDLCSLIGREKDLYQFESSRSNSGKGYRDSGASSSYIDSYQPPPPPHSTSTSTRRDYSYREVYDKMVHAVKVALNDTVKSKNYTLSRERYKDISKLICKRMMSEANISKKYANRREDELIDMVLVYIKNNMDERDFF